LQKLCKLAGFCLQSSDRKAEQLKSTGADHVINTSHEGDVQAGWSRATASRARGRRGRVELCINYIGGGTWDVVDDASPALGASQRLDCQLVSRHSALSHASPA
jgi:NADPH:quinone reductase-like Zn-dependent oxidoreductase